MPRKLGFGDLKAGKRLKLKDGETGPIRGAYMSTDGLILTVQTHPDRPLIARNVPLAQIDEVDGESVEL